MRTWTTSGWARWSAVAAVLLAAACTRSAVPNAEDVSDTRSDAEALPTRGGGSVVGDTGDEDGAAGAGGATAGDLRVTGPYTHENLSLFLVHGDDKIEADRFLTLGEGIEAGAVVVHETGDVNQLAVENTSETDAVFVQAGDIVKGGRQDRVMAVDLVVPPGSGRVPIASFCVEQGRWSQRGGEAAHAFNASTQVISTKALKLAVRYQAEQGEVWKEVAEAQGKLAENAGGQVRQAASATSMQLSLESGAVQDAAHAYVEALQRVIVESPDILGVVVAVNGEVTGADVYGSGRLFRKLWPKLLQSAAVEAVAELGGERSEQADARSGEGSTGANAPLTAARAAAWLVSAEQAASEAREVNRRTRLVTHDAEANVLYEARLQDEDGNDTGAWVRRCYIAK